MQQAADLPIIFAIYIMQLNKTIRALNDTTRISQRTGR